MNTATFGSGSSQSEPTGLVYRSHHGDAVVRVSESGRDFPDWQAAEDYLSACWAGEIEPDFTITRGALIRLEECGAIVPAELSP